MAQLVIELDHKFQSINRPPFRGPTVGCNCEITFLQLTLPLMGRWSTSGRLR